MRLEESRQRVMIYLDKTARVVAHQVSNDEAFTWRDLEVLHTSLDKLEDGNLGLFGLGGIGVFDFESLSGLERIVDDEQRIAAAEEVP